MSNIIYHAADQSVRVICSENNWLEAAAIEQLKHTAQLPGMKITVGMPDLHPGRGNPIGAAFISEGAIYPHLVGSDIGCGMSLLRLSCPAKKIKLDKWQKKLTGLDDLLEDPSDYIKTLCEDIEESLAAYHNKLGTIGGGNHFAEIQAIAQIVDPKYAKELAIEKGQAFLLVHSGSRGLGQAILNDHNEHWGARPLLADDQKLYQKRHDYACRWAALNRHVIAQRFMERLGIKGEPLLDLNHNMVLPLSNNERDTLGLKPAQYWIHRKGASPMTQGHVVIPGSRGSYSYLVKPRESEAAVAGFSLAHGAGRKWKRSDSKARLQKRFKKEDLLVTSLGSRVICENKELLYEEAPEAYKNIDIVIDDLVNAELIDVVAILKPLITYKTRRKK